MTTSQLLTVAASIEAATGIALITTPALVTQLLLRESASGVGTVVSRVAGVSLLALAIAAWPERAVSDVARRPLLGLLTYNALVAGYLLYIGMRTEWVGALLWPVVALHLVFTVLLARAWLQRPGDYSAP